VERRPGAALHSKAVPGRQSAGHPPPWPALCDVRLGEHWQGPRMALGPPPHTAAGDGIPSAGAGTPWRGRLPVALVIFTLVALLAVPVVVSRRGAVIREEATEVWEPARLLVNRLEVSVAQQAAAIRGYIIDGQPRHLEQYRDARAQEARALQALRPLVQQLGPAAASELARLDALLEQWHAQQDSVAATRVTPRAYAVVLPAQDELYRQVLNGTTRLVDTIVAHVNQRRRESAAIQRLGVVLSSILVVMALASSLFVVRLSQRLERRTRELAASEARERFLSDGARILASSIDYEDTLRATADLAVPAFADICLIDIVQENDEIRRIVSTSPTPDIDRQARRLEAFAPKPGSRHPIFEAMRTGRSMVLTEWEAVEASAQSAEHLAVLREISPRFILLVPLIARGRALGAIQFMATRPERVYGPEDVALAEDLAGRAALAIDNARLYQAARRAREEAERRRAELVRLTESRSRLMRGFGHDVKNPLGAADGYLQLLEEGVAGELEEKVREGVSRARRSIRTALELIEDLLALARWEASQVEVEPSPTDVREVVRTIAEEYRAQAESKGLELRTEVPEELSLIESDAARIRQVLSNLLSNALKFTERGSITVRVEEREDGAAPTPGGWVAIDVVDTGPGIPKEKQRLLFREFTRLEPGKRRGAGVGLAMSRRIARALRGDVTLVSTPGKGSTFTLWLPVIGTRPGARKAA